MSQSIFSGLSLVRTGRRIDITFPASLHDAAHATAAAREHGLEVSGDGSQPWRLQYDSEHAYPARLKAFFSALNDQRPPFGAFDATRLRAGEPLVSCIIAVNENLPFVEEQLLPSLVGSSSVPIELIIVCNGFATPRQAMPGLVLVRSEWGTVSKAYNAGAAVARGTYLAFFHDDCIMHDPLWVEKCMQRLERGAHAVAAEYRQIDLIAAIAVPALPVAKCVPLVLRRGDFEAAGRFDERHYIGFEDLDFTLCLSAQGMKLVATDLEVAHFHGMSSTLKYHPVRGLADLYALGAVPRFAVMRRFNEFFRAGTPSVEAMRVATDAQLLYTLRKHAGFLSGIDRKAYARAENALETRIAASCPQGPGMALARFRALDHEVAEAARARA
jgi:hypothetical protein